MDKKGKDKYSNMGDSYNKFILYDDLRLIIIPKHSTNALTAAIFINAGSNNETKENNGVAHYLEHLMFKGTIKRPQLSLVKELDKLGVKYNAMTGKEFTGYYISGNARDYKQIIEIMIDLYSNSEITQNAIDKERSVIIEEMNMTLNDPTEILLDKMHQKIFWNSSMGLSIIGSKNNIINMKKNHFSEFKQKFYTSSNTIIVICGNISTSNVHNLIKQKIKSKINIDKKYEQKYCNYEDNNNNNEKLSKLQCQLQQKVPYVYLKNAKLLQTQVLFAFRTIPNARGLDILSDILTTGLGSRLFMALRQKMGYTYTIHSGYIGYKNDGIFTIMFGIDNNSIIQSIRIVLSELLKLRKGITSEELKKAKKQRQTNFLLSLQSVTDLAFFYGLNELDHKLTKSFIKRPNPIKEVFEEYKYIKENEINQLIKETFIKENFNLFVYGNTIPVKKNINKIQKAIDLLN